MTTELTPRQLGAIIRGVFDIFRKYFPALITIVAIPHIILFVIGRGIGVDLQSGEFGSPFMFLVYVLFAVLAYVVMECALIYGVAEASLGREVNIKNAYSFAFARLWTVILASLMVMIAVGLMAVTVIGIPAAIYFAIRWSFVLPAIMLEDVGPREALSSSSELVRGTWWRVFGILIVLGLLTAVVSGLLNLVLFFVPEVRGTVANIISTPITMIGTVLLYFDLRVRARGYSVEMLEEELVR
ncbi:MAG: glycerophosphoryl diester phosphodiesterase membrane domain-containing protein [Candidatus Adiutricales bacterium]